MSNFILRFPLKINKFQDDILNKRFEIARKIYNSLVNVTQKRYKELIKTKVYREIKTKLFEIYNSETKDNEKLKKDLYKNLKNLYKQYNLTEYSFHKDVKNMQKYYKKNIDSSTAQKIATTLWKSYDKFLFGNGEKVHYKRFDTLNSVEGKSNKTGIRFKDDTLFWNGLEIPINIKYNNYEQHAFKNDISYIRLIRKYIRTKYKFYIQIVFKGVPPQKRNFNNKSRVGLDIGTQTIAISSKKKVQLLELADRIQNIENKKRILLRKLDRSRRTNNPDNYNLDGTIKKQGNKKVIWIKSKKYIKIQNQLKELYRKQADIRKYQHEKLANDILSLGTNIYVETMNYKGLQKKSKEITINEKTGKYNRKKRFGKSLANKAPAMLLEIINRKLNYQDEKLIKINTFKVKASQYNHITNEYIKKDLNQRFNQDINIQRDLYSAFLIMNVNDDLETINRDLCFKTFDDFKKLHDNEILRLKNKKQNNKLISSMGI